MTCDLRHVRLGFERGHDHVQMFDIAQVHVNDKAIEIGLSVREPQVRDIGLLFADQGADAPQNARVVGYRDIQADREHRRMTALSLIHI